MKKLLLSKNVKLFLLNILIKLLALNLSFFIISGSKVFAAAASESLELEEGAEQVIPAGASAGSASAGSAATRNIRVRSMRSNSFARLLGAGGDRIANIASTIQLVVILGANSEQATGIALSSTDESETLFQYVLTVAHGTMLGDKDISQVVIAGNEESISVQLPIDESSFPDILHRLGENTWSFYEVIPLSKIHILAGDELNIDPLAYISEQLQVLTDWEKSVGSNRASSLCKNAKGEIYEIETDLAVLKLKNPLPVLPNKRLISLQQLVLPQNIISAPIQNDRYEYFFIGYHYDKNEFRLNNRIRNAYNLRSRIDLSGDNLILSANISPFMIKSKRMGNLKFDNKGGCSFFNTRKTMEGKDDGLLDGGMSGGGLFIVDKFDDDRLYLGGLLISTDSLDYLSRFLSIIDSDIETVQSAINEIKSNLEGHDFTISDNFQCLSDRVQMQIRSIILPEIPSPVIENEQHCAFCFKNSTNSSARLVLCGRCKQVYYCNEWCQRHHWKRHKVVCSYRKNIKEE
ncbi:MAG: zinc finger MYND domain-containing protein [Oligoflexia bacterium]|nr:zinc finger MYND domain-containing protein [Oligoflexia bacterium]